MKLEEFCDIIIITTAMTGYSSFGRVKFLLRRGMGQSPNININSKKEQNDEMQIMSARVPCGS